MLFKWTIFFNFLSSSGDCIFYINLPTYILYRNWYSLSEKKMNTSYDRGGKKTETYFWNNKDVFFNFALKIVFILSRFVKLNDIVKMKVQSRTSICFFASIILAVTFLNVVDAASTQPRCTDDELVIFILFLNSNYNSRARPEE